VSLLSVFANTVSWPVKMIGIPVVAES